LQKHAVNLPRAAVSIIRNWFFGPKTTGLGRRICPGGFAANMRRSLNAPQRPPQPSQRMTCCFFSWLKTLLT
jgi:hypothetical protein